MQLTRIGIGLLLGLGLLAGGCGGDETPAPEAATPPAAKRPGAAATPQASPQAAAKPAAAGPERLRQQIKASHGDATEEQVDCLTDGIIELIGQERFVDLVGIGLREKAGAQAVSARSPEDAADMQKLEALSAECGVSED